MPTESETLEELVGNAAEGDRGAQEELLHRFWPVIRQAVKGRKSRLGQNLAAREQTQDLEQQAAIKLLGNLRQHAWQGRSAFAAWVKKLAEHGVVDAYRHHRALKRDAAAEIELERADDVARRTRSAESRYDDHAKVEALMEQIQQLKAEYGAALLLHHMGFAHAEIGETLSCSAEAARKLVTRARRKLLQLRDAEEAEAQAVAKSKAEKAS